MHQFKVPTYEQRVAKIKKIEDISLQINRAQNYAKRINSASKNQPLRVKIELKRLYKQAQEVVDRLRLTKFEIEDRLRLKLQPASSITTTPNNTPISAWL